jgi:protein-tyrosine phosphatase
VERLAPLIRRGALVQLTAGSQRGDFGRTAQRFCWELLDRRMAHLIASDAHDTRSRPPEVLATVDGAIAARALPRTLAPWLTREVPAALLAGEDAPACPAPAAAYRRAKRRWSFMR